MPLNVTQQRRQPVLFVPRIVLILLFLLILIHIFRAFVAADYDDFIISMFGVLPGRYQPEVIHAFPGGIWSAIPSFLTYAFLHADFAHLAINAAWLLAFGSAVVRVAGSGRFLVLYLSSAVVAGLAHVVADSGSLVPMVGASGAISGAMGAGFRAMPMLPGFTENPVRDDFAPAARARLLSLTDRRFLLMSGVWLLGNILFGLTGIRVGEEVLMIAWDAHVAGFVTGALLIRFLIR